MALATAGAYLQRSTFTFERYLHEYSTRWNIGRPAKLQEYEERTLYTTWDLLYARLETEDQDAANLLKLLAYFSNQSLWYDLFYAGVADSSPEWLRRVVGNDAKFESVMRTLTDYFFLEVHPTLESWSMHNCVHDWILASLNKNIIAERYWYAFDCVSMSLTDVNPDTFAHVSCSPLAAHATRLVQLSICQNEILNYITSDRLMQASMIGHLLQEQVLLLASEQMYQRALARYEKALGPDHTSTLQTINNVGILYRGQGRLDEAEKMYQRALAGKEKALGPDHTLTLNTVNNLGNLYLDQRKLDQAEQMYQRALAGREKELGPDHMLTLEVINNLGILYRRRGRLDEAEQMYQRALARREKELRPDHMLTLETINNLGNLYLDQRKFDQAEEIY